MKKILVSMLLILSIRSSWANEKTLTQFVSEEVATMDLAFTQMTANENPGSEDDAFIFRRFWLRLRPRVGLHVPGFATFDVIPEVEMLWEKDLPDGWETYRP